MIPPYALLELDSADAAGGRAAVNAVQPTVGSLSEMVRHRLGVFHAEAGEQHFGVAVRHIVAVGVGIEEQVRDVEDKDAPVSEFHSGNQVQPVQEIFELVGAAVAIDIFENRNAISPSRT